MTHYLEILILLHIMMTNTSHPHYRSAKYVLVKLIRSELEVDNIDIQYLGFVGYSGARSFANARLC